MNNEGRYMYAIIEGKENPEPQEFGNLGIGGRGDRVYTVHYQDLAAVVSSSPITKYPVSRENTLDHQRVLEKVMEEFTVLPVRFCTIAEHEEDIEEKVLKARYKEFKNLLGEMKDKIELGVRAMWTNMEKIFVEIVEENKDIKQLKKKIAKSSSEQKRYAGRIKIGELVQKALEKKKEKEAKELLAALKPLSVDLKQNQVYGDRNIFNAAFLVKKTPQHQNKVRCGVPRTDPRSGSWAEEEKFDQRINALEKELGERTKLKYFGPVPPYNFVEVVVTW